MLIDDNNLTMCCIFLDCRVCKSDVVELSCEEFELLAVSISWAQLEAPVAGLSALVKFCDSDRLAIFSKIRDLKDMKLLYN